jgi:hypothetical protein
MQTFATPAPVRVVLDIPAGRVTLVAADRADTTVEVHPADPGKGRDVKAAEQATVTHKDGVVWINAAAPHNQLLGASGSLDVTVHLPAGSGVEARTATTELHGVGRLGEVAYEGAYRQIKIEEAASLHLTAVDGDVEVGRVGGPAKVTTARGDITVAEAVSGTVELRTASGSITVGVAAGVSASLDADTTHGRVANSLKNDGTTAVEIHATTSNGDITARSL